MKKTVENYNDSLSLSPKKKIENYNCSLQKIFLGKGADEILVLRDHFLSLTVRLTTILQNLRFLGRLSV